MLQLKRPSSWIHTFRRECIDALHVLDKAHNTWFCIHYHQKSICFKIWTKSAKSVFMITADFCLLYAPLWEIIDKNRLPQNLKNDTYNLIYFWYSIIDNKKSYITTNPSIIYYTVLFMHKVFTQSKISTNRSKTSYLHHSITRRPYLINPTFQNIVDFPRISHSLRSLSIRIG